MDKLQKPIPSEPPSQLQPALDFAAALRAEVKEAHPEYSDETIRELVEAM
jgi:hypothetical protein